jgi:tetratricopeptide (TPR) repeat protein
LANAQAAAGGDLALLFVREDLRLSHSEHRLAIARRRAEHDTHPKAQSLVTRMETEHNRLEIEILNVRVERQPGAVALRIDLARRLKRAGNFSGAIQRLDEVAKLAPQEPIILCEMGECWQHLRQFAKALDFYREAGRLAKSCGPSDAALLLAHYRAATLLAAMGQVASARISLETIVAADPAYKDARERLDKLAAN